MVSPEERAIKQVGDWLVAQTKLDPPAYKQRKRAYKRPPAEEVERLKKKALVALVGSELRRRAR